MFSPKILHDAAILWYKEHAPRFTPVLPNICKYHFIMDFYIYTYFYLVLEGLLWHTALTQRGLPK